jgi:DNA helicase-2/ATP-dependent DNA helicase PcrA
LRDFLTSITRWRGQRDALPQTELAEMVLDESGYTEMWQRDRSADAAGRLENLKELVRSMEEFESLQGFLEHISLVMERDQAENVDAVSIMTLHSAKGLEFDTVFLPGWEEGLFPHQRALDEGGRASLEEERRLAYVGLTRAKRLAKIAFAANRRIHGLWQTTLPSRFLKELPEAHVEIEETTGLFGGYGYGPSRFEDRNPFANTYDTPGWRRAQANRLESESRGRRMPPTIEGDLVAKSVGAAGSYEVGERVFHAKFGEGRVTFVDGNKLTIDFDHTGEKRVLDSFVRRLA